MSLVPLIAVTARTVIYDMIEELKEASKKEDGLKCSEILLMISRTANNGIEELEIIAKLENMSGSEE